MYKIVYDFEGRLLPMSVPIKCATEYVPKKIHLPKGGWGPFAVWSTLLDVSNFCISLTKCDRSFDTAKYQLWRALGVKSEEPHLYMPGYLFNCEFPIVQPVPDDVTLLSQVCLSECLAAGTLTDLSKVA